MHRAALEGLGLWLGLDPPMHAPHMCQSPPPWCPAQVVDSEERAQTISRARTANAEHRRRAAIAARMAAAQRGAAAEGEGEAQRTLPLIVKADVQGSAEAVRDAVAHMSTENVRVQVRTAPLGLGVSKHARGCVRVLAGVGPQPVFPDQGRKQARLLLGVMCAWLHRHTAGRGPVLAAWRRWCMWVWGPSRGRTCSWRCRWGPRSWGSTCVPPLPTWRLWPR
jgi:hypothetical protein